MDWADYTREQALEETGHLLHQGDAEALASTPVKKVLQASKEFVDVICNGVAYNQDSDFNLTLLLRCVAKKSQESLIQITELTEGSQAYYAMPLLRPMCEELIYIRFMKSLPREDADDYLRDRVMLDLHKGLEAQRGFFDTLQNEYPDHIKERYKPHHGEALDLPTKIRERQTRLKAFGKKLGWGSLHTPKVSDMAKATDSEDEYTFFYHATSSAVHANLHHIARMVWGSPDAGMTITNRNFNTYYQRFALTYGAWLTTAILDEVSSEFPEQWHEYAEADYDIWRDFVQFIVGATRFPPIVTERELQWPEP